MPPGFLAEQCCPSYCSGPHWVRSLHIVSLKELPASSYCRHSFYLPFPDAGLGCQALPCGHRLLQRVPKQVRQELFDKPFLSHVLMRLNSHQVAMPSREFRKLHEERSDVANAARGKGPAWEASVAPRAELENACGGGPCGRRLLKVMRATT